MSALNEFVDLIGEDEIAQIDEIRVAEFLQQHYSEEVKEYEPFNIKHFADELKIENDLTTRAYLEYSSNVSAYDIANNCILSIVKKLTNHPIENLSSWLPVLMRSTMGTAIHKFIQDHSSQFTEKELSLKIPSIRFSGRLDAMIGPEILCEIKSCTYDDYKKVVETHKPRIADFYQTITYKYILENFLDEAKLQTLKSKENPGGTRTPPPRLDKYNITKLQYIYVANNLISDDLEDIGKCIEVMKNLKKMMNSKSDQFFFITSVVLDTKDFDCSPYIDFVKRKIERIKYYLDSNKLPFEDEFVDTKKCFFCPYRSNCELTK